ncbi:MAG: hypothetical protein HKP30_17710, partial [Myxococcales bacterium]|nr:hypothetical protein [Myxococcales bacterium]
MAFAVPALAKPPSWQYAELTPDVQWVIGAIATRMQNQPIEGKAAKYVSFGGDLARRIPEERFRYAGFTLRTIAVDGYHALETDPDERWVSAVLRFRDVIGREAS